MKITIGSLKRLIRDALLEGGGGTTMPPRPMIRNPMSPSMADREQIGKNSIQNMDTDEISPHLKDPVYDEEDCYGPVPPNAEQPYALPDPFAQDFNVIPTPQIRR